MRRRPPPRKPVKAKRAGQPSFHLPKWWRLSTGATLVAIPVVWIVYLAVVPVMAWSSVSTLQAWPAGNRPAEQPGTTAPQENSFMLPMSARGRRS